MDQAHASVMDAVPPRRSWGIDPTELLAVIAIIAVLAASALRYYEQALVKAAVSEAQSATQVLRRESWQEHDRTGRWPGGDAPHSIGNLSAIESDPDGAMTVTFGPRIPAIAGRRLTFHPVVVPGADLTVMRWSCGMRAPAPPAVALGRDRTDLPDAYLMHQCRQGAQP